MATRGQIHFKNDGVIRANIYEHYDMYPDSENGVLGRIHQFFLDVKDQCSDTRFGDGEYLAAKYIVWHAINNCTDENPNPLNFLGIGPCTEDHGDVEYVYTVDCSKRDSDGFPVVSYDVAGWRKRMQTTTA